MTTQMIATWGRLRGPVRAYAGEVGRISVSRKPALVVERRLSPSNLYLAAYSCDGITGRYLPIGPLWRDLEKVNSLWAAVLSIGYSGDSLSTEVDDVSL